MGTRIDSLTDKLGQALIKFDISVEGLSSINNKDASGKPQCKLTIKFRNEDVKTCYVWSVFKDLLGDATSRMIGKSFCFTFNPDEENAFLENFPEDFFETLYLNQMVLKTCPETVHAETINIGLEAEEKWFIQPKNESLLKNYASVEINNLYEPAVTSCREITKTRTDDAGNIIFIDGLPSLVIADGAYGSNSEPPQILCNDILPRILPTYVSQLSLGKDPQIVMQALLQTVNEKSNELNVQYGAKGGAQFTFSCAISYTDYMDAEKTKVASIGVGSDMIMLYRKPKKSDIGGSVPYSPYFPIRAAENLCSPDMKENIQNFLESVPHQKQFLPAFNKSEISALMRQKVIIVPLETDDQLIGLSDGAFDGFDKAEYMERIISGNDTDGFCVSRAFREDAHICPENLFDENAYIIREQSVKENSKGKGDDAILIKAFIPDETRRNAINKASLNFYKDRIITILDKNYLEGCGLFHHHRNRCLQVCKAIAKATSTQQVALILMNQKSMASVMEQAVFMPLGNTILEERWSKQVKNKFTKTSGYQKAIQLAREELDNITRVSPR